MAGLTEFVTALTTNIAPIGVTFGRKGRGTMIAAPYITIYPVSEEYDRPAGMGASANPRALHMRKTSIEIHCLGVDTGQAEQIAAIVITATRVAMGGAGYVLNGGEWKDSEATDYGQVLILRITLLMALAEQLLPPSTFGDKTYPTTTIQSEGLDPTGQTTGAGYIYPG